MDSKVVETIKSHKNYLGGYRDTASGKLFFNAGAQTMYAHEFGEPKEKAHRDAQTVDVHHRFVQGTYEQSTQTPHRGCLMETYSLNPNNPRERIIVATGKSISADEYHRRRNVAAIKIQAFFRSIKAIRKYRTMREEKSMDDEYKSNLNRARERVRMNLELNLPESLLSAAQWKSVLDSLNDSLVHWEETGHTKLDQALENAGRPLNWYSKRAALASGGMITDKDLLEMDTPEMNRARELVSLSSALKTRGNSAEDRLKLLNNLRYTVSEFSSRTIDELLYLIERETDWLSRGRSKHSLEGVRVRIDHLFLLFIKNPEYNPAILRIDYMRPDKDDEALRKCSACFKYLPPSQFKHLHDIDQMSEDDDDSSDYLCDDSEHDGHDFKMPSTEVKTDKAGKCHTCLMQFFTADHQATDRELQTLKMIMRIEERVKKSQLKAMFGIKTNQESAQSLHVQGYVPLRNLMVSIWDSRAYNINAIKYASKEEERRAGTMIPIVDLVFTRWNLAIALDASNCILLTVDEASAHDKFQLDLLSQQVGTPSQEELEKALDDALSTRYGPSISKDIKKRHLSGARLSNIASID